MTKKKRVLLLLLTALVLAAMLFSAAEPQHRCCGRGCPVCAVVHLAQRLLGLLAGVILLHTPAAAAAACTALHHLFLRAAPSPTPVLLKVKLSD